MKKIRYCAAWVLLSTLLSACQQAPQWQGRAEVSPQGKSARGTYIGLSNESGTHQVYGSVSAQIER